MEPATHLHLPSLFSVTASRQIEQALMAHHSALGAHYLMAQAGKTVAKLALAIAPHARSIWVACGPGNNGGDGLIAAVHLLRAGRQVHVTHDGSGSGARPLPNDALWAMSQLEQARQSQRQGALLTIAPFDPSQLPPPSDLVIDALLGIGGSKPLAGDMLAQVEHINHLHQNVGTLVLAVDNPTGLAADSGAIQGTTAVQASHTLCLVCLRPGLFTAMGRQLCGQIWLDDLGAAALQARSDEPVPWPKPIARWGHLKSPESHFGKPTRSHASHKGSFGDVAVVGGAEGMQGAAILAAAAAQQMGAGRVFLGLLSSPPIAHPIPADLMLRGWQSLPLAQCTVVAGCGAGEQVKDVLPHLLQQCKRIVLDADALNAVATDPSLAALVRARRSHGWETILSPHPKEAGRLLGLTPEQVQTDRLDAARLLAEAFQCTVALKGSGTILMAPDEIPLVNATGNGKLAIAGTGDVLAGMMGSLLAQGHSAFLAAQMACYWHGKVADQWPPRKPLTASALLSHLPQT
jgi:ADP-dependent NAD(P)H-hydrate dehydratase / NAD(P)H-hydrate epimerase